MTAAYYQAIPERQRSVVDGWQDVIARMLRWMAAMCHQDGEIGFFNDAAIGIAPSPNDLDVYALRLEFLRFSAQIEGVTHLENSGYLRIQHGPMTALIDAAPVGPDYLPAHGHADTLSFELSLFGQRVLVNSGTSHYGIDAERLRERGTAAHNTVVVDGLDSSEVWGSFRVARRALPALLSITQQEHQIIVDASHGGYRHLPGRNIHRRRWVVADDSMIIEDEITGSFNSAEARFHLHPYIKIDEYHSRDGRVVLFLQDGQRVEFATDSGYLRLERSFWHPGFGENVPNLCLAVNFSSSKLKTNISWREN